MDPEVLQDFEKRQARINNIQSSLQSGDLKSRCVHNSFPGAPLRQLQLSSFSALLAAADEDSGAGEQSSSETKAAPSSLKHRGGGKNKRR